MKNKGFVQVRKAMSYEIRYEKNGLQKNVHAAAGVSHRTFCTVFDGSIKFDCVQTKIIENVPQVLRPVSRKPRKFFGPVKPFLVHLYLKTEKCTRLKFLL